MNFDERALRFPCQNAWLYGVLSLPEQAPEPAGRAPVRGVLIVVGGPQYRAGSHRQFTLIARYLASQGIPAMRFDYRGMGDSDGDARNFESIDADLRCAIDQFTVSIPGMEEVVIWGLCDAASAALFYAHQDKRVAGLVLINPWVRTDEGIAKAYLKHYYLSRMLDPDLWRKIFRGRFNYAETIRSFSTLVGNAFAGRRKSKASASSATVAGRGAGPLPDRMHDGLSRFKGKVLLILCGKDMTAMEFSDLVQGSDKWQKLLGSLEVTRRDLPEANHTFSQRDWREQVAAWTADWVRGW
jgi:exosortase A-associated hydrolase 1